MELRRSNRTCEAQFDLRTRAGAAPDGHVCADLSGAFPDSAEAMMSWAALFQNLGGNAVAIIPNSQPEDPFCKTNFSLNVAGAGVPEGIPCAGRDRSRACHNARECDGAGV